MKIEEAKKKWCPWSRVVDLDDGTRTAGNRIHNHIPESSMCITDRCMLWYRPGTDDGWCELGNIQK